MKKNLAKTAVIISIVTLIISVAALVCAMNKAPAPAPAAQEPVAAEDDQANDAAAEDAQAKDVQYVLYLGTNDKDTNEPVFTPEEAKKKAIQILLDHFGGYTIQEANGGWVDGDKVYTEYTMVIYLSDTDIEAVHAAAKEMIDTFRQSSVLIQANETTTEFYDGTN